MFLFVVTERVKLAMSGNVQELWRQIHNSFEYHRKPTDPDAQSAMDRIAMKCLGLPVRRSFNATNCRVREELLSAASLFNLQTYHNRTTPHPLGDGPVVVLAYDGAKVVIDGNNRVNSWRADNQKGPFRAIFVEPVEE